jgi:hypothetical protein
MNLKIPALLLLLTSIMACKKTEDSTTSSSSSISATAIGTWKMVKKAYDENNNLVIDADEWEIPAPEFSATVTLYGDSTGIMIRTFTGQSNDTALFSWSRPAEAEITSKLIKGGPSYIAKFAHIEKLTGSEMVLVDTARLGTAWELNWTFFSR